VKKSAVKKAPSAKQTTETVEKPKRRSCAKKK